VHELVEVQQVAVEENVALTLELLEDWTVNHLLEDQVDGLPHDETCGFLSLDDATMLEFQQEAEVNIFEGF
jgi:hypothetical protein